MRVANDSRKGSMRLSIRTGLALLLWLSVPALTAPAFASKKDDKMASAQLKMAQNLYQAGRFREALGAIDGVVKQQPRSVPGHLMRGMILYNMDQQTEALAEFDRTLSLQPAHTDARIYRASALANLKRYDDAMADYQKALSDLTYAQPERIHVNIGMLQRTRGETDRAIESFKAAVNLNNSYARAYYELGITYEDLGRNPEALHAYQDALVGMDDVPELHLRLGRANLAAGNSLKAREHFEKVTKLAPNGPEAAQARDQMAKIHPPS